MKQNILKQILITGLLFTGIACTKLDETDVLYDQVTNDKFGKTDLEVSSLVVAAYTNLSGMGSNGHYIPLGEVSSDEMVVPTRGADWGDGGNWVRLKQHKYVSTDPRPSDGWNFCYSGITTCNRLIANLTTLNTPTSLAYIPELKVLRAFYYYLLLDWYRNVPLAIDYNDTKPPSNAAPSEVFNFIESELTTNGPLLKKPTSVPDVATYGRMNYYVAEAILAKLYLNSEVWTGKANYDKAIAACDIIINSGIYSLSATYAENFTPTNQGSKESIFALPYDHIHFGGFNIPMMTLSYLNQKTYNISEQPWNGFAATTEFYNSYIDPTQNPGPQGRVIGIDPKGDSVTGTADKRLSNFIVGPQYASDGSRLIDDGADAADPDGKQFTFTPYINELQPQAWRQSGARIGKWQFYQGMTRDLDNDFAVLRYADILLVKAEASARLANNWNNPVALAIVNQIRTQHGGVTPYATMTAATFLAERGREMFSEGTRRQDMIRFGTFNNAFQFHDKDADTHVNIYPIPDAQINANKNLKQNTGY